MNRTITQLVKKNTRLYVMARTIHDLKTKTLYDLLYGYYERSEKSTTLLLSQFGEENADKMIYYICYGEKEAYECGFWGLMNMSLIKLSFLDNYPFIPCIHWGKGVYYHESGMDYITENVFEYYFEPVAGFTWEEVKKSRNIVNMAMNCNCSIELQKGPYSWNDEDIKKLGILYKKYVRLNEKTRIDLEKAIRKTLNGGKTLGVHIRGTDFRLGCKSHPIAVDKEDYMAKTREIFQKGEYDQIFLATDDKKAYEAFKKSFGNHMVCYDDVIRSDNDLSVICIQGSRPLHRYKLGFEVLRDVYTLACCNSLVAGLSSVSYAARYINVAIGRKFDEVVILDKGLYKHYNMRKIRKAQRMINKIAQTYNKS